jgi:DNA-binding MarR family transcriptional regulator
VVVTSTETLTHEIRMAILRLVAQVCLDEHVASQRLGLGGTDVRFLTLLDVHGPLTPGRLATLTGLTTGSVTGVIDRLERAGFVGRERDGTDRRKVIVVPVPDAAGRLTEERRNRMDLLDAILARRNGSELRVIADFLNEVAGELDER